MIGDSDLAVAKLYDMLPAEETGTFEGTAGYESNRSYRFHHWPG